MQLRWHPRGRSLIQIRLRKDSANYITGHPLHHSFTPLNALSQPHLQQAFPGNQKSSPELQQAFPGNLPAKSARETSRPTKQVDELQISLSFLVQYPSLIPRSAVDYLLLTSSLFASITRRLNRSWWNTLLLFLMWTPLPLSRSTFHSQCSTPNT